MRAWRYVVARMKFATDPDLGAVQRVMAGHPAALLELYDRHAPLIFAHAYASLGDARAAEDVVQETFTAAWFEVRTWFGARRDVLESLVDIARSRLAARAAEITAAATPVSITLPRGLRDRVLDSIYGAGERLRPPFATPEWALDVSGRWIVWLLVLGEAMLIFALA